jgi:predicted metalloprotease with PDZ domain
MRTLILLLSVLLPLAAQDAVRYTLRFPEPHTHYLEVSASVPASGPTLELYMAVWTPGSYLVREYARHVESFQARNAAGRDLQWSKSAKNRWRVRTGGGPRVEIAYKVYAHEMTVQGNWVDAGFAMLNGAPNFMSPVRGEKRPFEVRLELPAAWSKSISGLKQGPVPHSYIAADFDDLLDSPIYAGNAPIHEFEVDGKQHYLVNEGEGPMWDGPASARDVAKIVAEFSRQWDGLPYEKYVFFNMIVEAGGGLEHRNSTWMNTSRWAYGNTSEQPDPPPGEPPARRANRLSWLGLVSHEFFHTWNVKRLRPVELGPFNYENEVYTRSLWLAEGVTSYYGELGLRRAALSTRDQYLRSLSRAIRQLQTTPGRLVTPLETSSFDTWIQLYRPNENTPNTAISYYTKGQIVGFLLDAKIRKLTEDRKSLDDVLNLSYHRYGNDRGYTPEQFRAVAAEVASADLSSFFRTALETTEELDYAEALDWFGLRFRSDTPRPGNGFRPLTGITTRVEEGRINITALRRGTAAYDAGFNVGDEILAVNGFRVRPAQWPSRLENYRPGDVVEVLVARRDKLVPLKLPLVQEKPEAWTLEVKPDATEAQKKRLRTWLRESI